MQIPHELPQFSGQPCLFIVAGSQEAKFYRLEDGVIAELDAFKFEKPHFSDREGFFESSSRIGVIRSGAVYEPPKAAIREEFKHQFKAHLAARALHRGIQRVILFTPGYLKNFILNTLPLDLIEHLKKVVEGNYFYEHPVALVGKLR